ncbi:hypothetical protein RFI_05380 [Reticulomyxa filosa]|uniref:Uncharacterized protein n=1 Tax=Reticulomyxa filosa TaxID=46433 RepID=X6NZJ3_RETFI|nr:hypothetical protein RFI_05380 [Reticulomyxa filosa]|eukprot:ETO31735.1 hypothetical protein RFI_05380 [Reticulomyxa filosa]
MLLHRCRLAVLKKIIIINNTNENHKYFFQKKYVNMETKELKWKEVTENGEGKEYKLRNSTNFNKYNHIPFVPHINFYQKDTTIQVIKIPSEMYGMRLSETQKLFS